MRLNSFEYLASEAVKTWVHGSERQFDTLTVSEYGTFDEATVDERELEQIVDDDGLEAAMHLAELWAVAGGYLDDDRDDGRLFFEEDAPKDPFLTERERELALPSYSVGAISANGQSFLDVIKTWGEDNYERLVIPQPDWDTAIELYQVTDDLLQSYDFDGAMNKVEIVGIETGVIDPEREDGRLFTQGPPDLFRTIREAQLAISELDTEEMPAVQMKSDFTIDEADIAGRDTEWLDGINRKRETNAVLEGTAWFEATFDDWKLLEPLDDTVNYAVSVEQFDPWTLELSVEKVWRREDNFIGLESLTIQAYDIEDGREQAEGDKEALLQVHEERGLQGMMRQVELQAMKNGELPTDQPNGELFRNGPPDRFETLAQQLEGEINPYWNTDNGEIDEPEPAQNPYWRLETLRVNNPDGEQIGHALQMVVYPHMEQPEDTVGAPDVPDNEPFQMLEMAHFENPEDVDIFSKEFRGYLVPGMLDGPELAEEVTRLEEHPIEWKVLEGQDLNDYRNAELTLTRTPEQWHPYNPNAERDARLEAEGMYTDPIHINEQNDDPSGVPDLDL